MRQLELLAPARDLECGVAAIDHGADAVYIGASRFGARAAATNSVEDVAALCDYAHRYGARVYATVNTIVYDDELTEATRLVGELARAGVDAVLVQDMALAEVVRREGMALHASTQTDNRTAAKVEWLRGEGFSRAVLARELSVDEIANVHRRVPDMELEAFVHGALCVSYSGQCYASWRCFGRSANRGECAQVCRLRFDLVDAGGQTVVRGRHLLSLKDLCLIDHLEAMAEAGVTSFKIEGRLKGPAYVKNVVAAYSQRLDEIVAAHPERYARASRGRVQLAFNPDLRKTFNRGYTTYFAHGRQGDMASMDTPKATGEPVGTVASVGRGCIMVSSHCTFANGDGLCFMDDQGELVGFRVNRAEHHRLYPQRMPQGLRPGAMLWRNSDAAFERTLSHHTADRRVGMGFILRKTPTGIALTASIEGGTDVEASMEMEHQRALKPVRDNIVRQLSRLGDTIYECVSVDVAHDFDIFVPSSALAALRREVVAKADAMVTAMPCHANAQPGDSTQRQMPLADGEQRVGAMLNIANNRARQFYAERGLADIAPAYELQADRRVPLMQCRYCLRHELGHCERHGGSRPQWREPLRLALPDGRRFRLEFDCRRCQMNVWEEKNQ